MPIHNSGEDALHGTLGEAVYPDDDHVPRETSCYVVPAPARGSHRCQDSLVDDLYTACVFPEKEREIEYWFRKLPHTSETATTVDISCMITNH